MKVEFGSRMLTRIDRGVEFLREVKAVAPRRIADSFYYSADRNRVECLVAPTEEEFKFMEDVLLEHMVFSDSESKLVIK